MDDELSTTPRKEHAKDLVEALTFQEEALENLKASLIDLQNNLTKMAEAFKAEDRKRLLELMRCPCGKITTLTEEGDALCSTCDKI